MIPGTRHRIAIAAILGSLLFLQIQNAPTVICMQENGTSRIEPAWIDGSCLCIHSADAPSTFATWNGSEWNSCRDISLKSDYIIEHSQSTVYSPESLPTSIAAIALLPGNTTLFYIITVPQSPGTGIFYLPLRC